MNPAYYRDLLAKYGPTYQAVDCGSAESHYLRLKTLLKIMEYDSSASLLDVGCGYGHLTEYIPIIYPCSHYHGIDAIPEMVAMAQMLYPLYCFEVGDIAHPKDEWQADYVLASGLFQFPSQYGVRNTIRAMFNLCRKGVACNFLCDGNVAECIMRPDEVLRMGLKLTSYVTLRADYLPNDFTLYLYKEKP